MTLAYIERDRDHGAASRHHLDRAVDLIHALPAATDRDRLMARALLAVGDCHRRAARYRMATDALHRARQLAETGDPVDLALLTEVYAALGITAKELAEFDRAEQWYTRIGQIHATAGTTLAEAATLQHNLAGLDHARQRYPHAEAHARQAVALRRRAPGSTDVDIAAHLHHLASIAHSDERADEAERLYREALTLKEQLLGTDHPDAGLVLHNLRTLLSEQHRHRSGGSTDAIVPPHQFPSEETGIGPEAGSRS